MQAYYYLLESLERHTQCIIIIIPVAKMAGLIPINYKKFSSYSLPFLFLNQVIEVNVPRFCLVKVGLQLYHAGLYSILQFESVLGCQLRHTGVQGVIQHVQKNCLNQKSGTEGPRLMRISLLRFFKKFHKFLLCKFWAILFHQCDLLGQKIAQKLP